MTMMKPVRFNRNPLQYAGNIEQPTAAEVKSTPSLFRASLDDAIKYGGDLTRAALNAMNIRGDRKYIIVDTKVHMLMPTFMPAIPSWHTDGAPRGAKPHPLAKGAPDIFLQEELPDSRFHLLVTGYGCLTEFVSEPTTLFVPEEPTTQLYAHIDKSIEGMKRQGWDKIISVPSCHVVEFDWWDIHRGIKATAHEWRFLIRVTESDHQKPNTDLREIIRTQQQVYVPERVGW